MTANSAFDGKINLVIQGEVTGDISEMCFRDPEYFRAGSLHLNSTYWEQLADRYPYYSNQCESSVKLDKESSIHLALFSTFQRVL